jgi:signal peptidase II
MIISWVPTLIFAIDQLTKRIATFVFPNHIFKYQIMNFYMQNTAHWNNGICGGLFANSSYIPLIYIGIAILFFVACRRWYYSKTTFDSIAYGLIIGGTMSNIADRIFFGGVLDFLLFGVEGWGRNIIVINCADIAIIVGICMLIKQYLKPAKKCKSTS